MTLISLYKPFDVSGHKYHNMQPTPITESRAVGTSPKEVWKYCHHESVIVKYPFNAFYSYSLLREKGPTARKSSFKTQLPLLSTWIICEYWNFCKLNVIQPISLMEKKVRRKRGSHNSSYSKTRNALNFLTL